MANPVPLDQAPEFGVRSHGSGVWDLGSGVRDPGLGPGIWVSGTGVRDPGCEVRSQLGRRVHRAGPPGRGLQPSLP